MNREASPDKDYRDHVARQQRFRSGAPLRRPLDFSPFAGALETVKATRLAELTELLLDTTIPLFHENLRNAAFTVTEAALWYLLRIRKMEERGVCAVLELNPDLLDHASAMDREMERDSPLWGVPVLLKDNIATGDRMHTTIGAAAMAESFGGTDAHIVTLLRDSGALILGKANMSEWAFFMARDGCAGYSALGGQTRNAYGNYDVGGSSSGSAVAVALDLAVASIGTETCGSIVNPASQNGVVGFKPGTGIVPLEGIAPIAPAFDSAGPFGRTVQDVAILYAVLAGAGHLESPDQPHTPKIGIVMNREYLDTHRTVDRSILRRLQRELVDAGFSVVDVELDSDVFALDMDDVLFCSFREAVADYLDKHPCEMAGLSDIIAFNEQNPDERAPFGQELLIAAAGSPVTVERCREKTGTIVSRARQAIDDALEQYSCDILLSINEYFSSVYAAAGYPGLNVPVGFHEDGEPVGMTLTTTIRREAILFSVGYRWEQFAKKRNRSTCFDG